MAKKKQRENSIARNKRAYYEYAVGETFVAGLVLTGAEIKSVRAKKASISEAYCFFDEAGIFKVKGMRISEFKNAGYVDQNPDREKLLLLSKQELKKIRNKLKDQGNTVIPLELFISEKGFAKLELAVAKGKKLHDKRDSKSNKAVQKEIDKYV